MSDDQISWKELLEIFGDSPTEMIKLKYMTAAFHEQRVEAVNDAIDWIVSEMCESARHNAGATEDALTTQIVINLRAIGFLASHDEDIGGHCDIVVKGKQGFRWLAEAKIHRDYDWLLKGFRQLATRYSTGLPGQDAGGMIIYHKGPRSDLMMSAWSDHLIKNEPETEISQCVGNSLSFLSEHVHVRSGARFKIRHVPINLYFNPQDRVASGVIKRTPERAHVPRSRRAAVAK